MTIEEMKRRKTALGLTNEMIAQAAAGQTEKSSCLLLKQSNTQVLPMATFLTIVWPAWLRNLPPDTTLQILLRRKTANTH